jgi:hypothetical protein
MRNKKRPTPKNGFGFLKISSIVNNDRNDHCFEKGQE